MLKYRVTTYENGKSLGSDTTIFGNYSSGYENYFWFPKYLTYDNDTYEYKYEFFVSSSDGKNINLRLSFDNVSKQTYDNKEIIVGDLSPHSDITLNNVFVSGHLIVFDKTGNVCYTSKIGTVFNDNTPVEISFPLLTSTAVEDMDFIIALNAVY